MVSLNTVIFYCLAASNSRGEELHQATNTRRQGLLESVLEAIDQSRLAGTQAPTDDAGTTTNAIGAQVTHGTTHCYPCHSQMHGLDTFQFPTSAATDKPYLESSYHRGSRAVFSSLHFR